MRVGIGFDAHRFAGGRRLVIGGVEIPHPAGLSGHSDADVLLHAVCDAMLGALALGDIGSHFPDSEPRFEGVSSAVLLAEVGKMVEREGYRVGNVDAVVIAQEPKIAPHVKKMRSVIANGLCCGVGAVSVKGTTTEGMGYCGRGEGIAATAVVILVPLKEEE